MSLLDEEDEIDDLDDDEIDDPDFCPQPVNQHRTAVNSENESDEEEDEDISTPNSLSPPPGTLPPPNKRRRAEKVNWKKRPLNIGDCSWQYTQRNTDEEDDSNIPKPYDLFKEYFPDEIMELLAEKTNQYAVHQNGESLNTNSNEIEVFLGVHVKMGTLPFPRVRMYWCSKKGTRIPAIADAMPVNRFFKLRSHLHAVDINNKPDNDDRLWKVRPLFDSVNNKCHKMKREEFYSIDEMMIPFTGNLNIKQYVKGKPNPWGVKLFLLCTSDGLVTNILDYQGKTTVIDDEYKSFGLGASVVLQLVNILPRQCNFKLAFDRFFTSLPLLRHLKIEKIYCVGTIRNNRIEKCPLSSEKVLKNSGRGSFDYRQDDSEIIVLKWYDNKPVLMCSSFVDGGAETLVRRWDKSNKEYVEIPRPEIISVYNQKMGGVDLIGKFVSQYRICIRSRKWTLRVIFHLVDLAICNSWVEYKKRCIDCGRLKKEIMDLMSFRDEVCDGLLMANKSICFSEDNLNTSTSSRAACVPPARATSCPSTAVRLDEHAHWPQLLDQKNASRCANPLCHKKSKFACMKCKKVLCIKQDSNCFYDYHHNDLN